MAELSWRDAIMRVLEGEPDPVHYAEVAEKIVAQGLKTQVGATPAASVAAELSTSLKQDGDASPFERVSRGYYRLRSAGVSPIGGTEAAKAVEDVAEPEAGLVNAFGMYWRREFAVWNPPRLLGQQQPGSTPVDFTQQRGVYLLHDRREVVYVGRTTDQGLGDRLKQHTVNRLNGRWDRFSWFGVYPVSGDGSLVVDAELAFSQDNLIATMEALLIEGLEPPQNRKRGDGFSAVEFIQVPDPELVKKQKKDLLGEMIEGL